MLCIGIVSYSAPAPWDLFTKCTFYNAISCPIPMQARTKAKVGVNQARVKLSHGSPKINI